MANNKRKAKNEPIIIRLKLQDFQKLTNIANLELAESRKKHTDVYVAELENTNSPAKALEKAELKSPISISYNYSVTKSFEDKESGETWTEISVSDEKEARRIESMFDVVKEEEEVAEPESDTNNQQEEQQTEEN